MATSCDARCPDPSDIIAIKWQHTQTTEQVKVISITQYCITLQYLDNNDIEELQLEDGHLPFEWQLLEKHNPSPSHTQDTDIQQTHDDVLPLPLQPPVQMNSDNVVQDPEPLYSNDVQNNTAYHHKYPQDEYNANYYNQGSRWQPKHKHEHMDDTQHQHQQQQQQHQQHQHQQHQHQQQQQQHQDKQVYFQKKRERYDETHAKAPSKPPSKPKMKRKEVPQHRPIARTLSAVTAVTTSTNTDKISTDYQSQSVFVPHAITETIPTAINRGQMPLKGDLVEISYAGGAQNDPVRIIHSTFHGDARIRYTDARGAENSVNLINNNDITFKITHSVYNAPDIDFIPAPRKGDTIEIIWAGDGGRDVVDILDVDAEYTEEYLRNKSETKVEEFKTDDHKQDVDINHYDRLNAIWITFQYVDDKEREKLDFHPNAQDSEILTWKILKCGGTAGLDIGDDIKWDELDNEICSVCCTSFGEFPYRTVVPCAHNNVCAKCTLRMRVFGDFNNDKHPYPMCPFCKESWEIVAFVPVSWTIAINNRFSSEEALSKHEWNVVFSRPLEYDDEVQCYFTDIVILQEFIHIRSLYCLLCNPMNKEITNYNKLFYFHNVGKLLAHLRQQHTSFMCELCLNNATLFINEQRLFVNNKKLLIDHQRNGSALEGQHGETAPHPFCTLCRRNFYSREALYEHCEDSHCWCLLCKQSGILEYYANNDILTQHHRDLHHLCEHRECLAKLQPVVFDDPLLLKSHQMQAHRMNKPVHAVRTAFTYGDDHGRSEGVLNFGTMFTQSDINYLSAARYGNNLYQPNDAQNIDISDEQRARIQQKELHRTMDQIKQRWFPHSFQREKQQLHKKRKALQLGLKHIPDAVPNELREDKNTVVIKQIRKTLISEVNFKRFQEISRSYKQSKISSSVFFHRFLNLFDTLCNETIWVDILIQMLSLLRDGKKRRALYEEYRDWVIGGRVRKFTKINWQSGRLATSTPTAIRKGGIASNASKKVQRTNVPSAADVVAGIRKYRKPTKEMIISQRRAQKGRARMMTSNVKATTIQKSISSPPNVKGKWKTGAPQINKPKTKKKKRDPTVPKITAKPTGAVRQHWPTLAPAKAGRPAPPKWVDEESVSSTQPLVVHKQPTEIHKKKKMKWVEDVSSVQPLIVHKQPTEIHKKKTKWVEDVSVGHKQQTEIHKKKKTKRGPRKSKKNKDMAMQIRKKEEVIENESKAVPLVHIVQTPVIPVIVAKSKPVKITPKGLMPHENKAKKTFNKSKPWGVRPPSPPKKAKKANKEKEVHVHVPVQRKASPKIHKKIHKKVHHEEKKVHADCVYDNGSVSTVVEQRRSECYFKDLNDAKSELQSVFVKLSNYKNTLYLGDKVGLFLVFLFECLYSVFEFNFDGNVKYESVELTAAWRQHIYQTVYEEFWSKNKKIWSQDKDRNRLKITEASYKIRVNDNVLSWNGFLYKLPPLSENSGTQFGALYDMLGVIDDGMDMTPLKPWIDMMDLKFDETYCMLLYIWFIVDIEIPSAPYPFIDRNESKNNQNKTKNEVKKVKKASPKAKRNSNVNKQKQQKQQQHQQQLQHHKKKGNKKGNKKKQKSKPVMLFKMGGM